MKELTYYAHQKCFKNMTTNIHHFIEKKQGSSLPIYYHPAQTLLFMKKKKLSDFRIFH